MFRCKNRNRRKHAKSICRKEYHIVGIRCGRNGFYYILNVIDRIRNTGVFGNTLIGKIYFSVFVYGNILQQCISFDSIVNVRFGFFVQIDNFCIAAAFKVKYAVVVPAVFVITYQQTFGIGGKSGFSGAGKTEENGCILAFHIRVGRTVHRGNALQRQIVIHHREHTFFHFSAIPSVDNHLFTGTGIEGNAGFRIQTQFLVIVHFCFGSIVNNKIRSKFCQLFCSGLYEHIFDKMCLPCHFHDKTHRHAGIFIGTAKSIYYIEFFIAQSVDSNLFHLCPHLLRHGVIVVFITFSSPPYFVVRISIVNNVFVFG